MPIFKHSYLMLGHIYFPMFYSKRMKGTKKPTFPQAKSARRKDIKQEMQSHRFSPYRSISWSIPSNRVSARDGKEGAEKRSITLCSMHLCPSLPGTFRHLGFSFVPLYILALGVLAVYQKALQCVTMRDPKRGQWSHCHSFST